MQVFDDFRFHGLELRPSGHVGVAVDVQSHTVAFGRVHGYEHVLGLRIDARMVHEVAAGIGAEQAEVGVYGAVHAVRVVVFLGEYGFAACHLLGFLLLLDEVGQEGIFPACFVKEFRRGRTDARVVDEDVVVDHARSHGKHVAPVLEGGGYQRVGRQHHHGVVEVLHFHHRQGHIHHDAVGYGGGDVDPVAHAEHVVLRQLDAGHESQNRILENQHQRRGESSQSGKQCHRRPVDKH